MPAYEGLAAVYDRLMDAEERSLWIDSTLSLLKAHGIRRGAEVLDLACGTGALTVPMAKAGYRVMGLDLSEEMLSEARRKAGAMPIRFIKGDMSSFRLPHPVDAVNCACDGVNYLIEDGAAKSCFSCAAKALKAGGLFVFDISTPKKLSAMNRQLYSLDEEDVTYIWRSALEGNTVTMDITFFVRTDTGLFERFDELHRQRLYTRNELTDSLTGAGFEVLKVTGGLGEEEASEDDLRWRFIAKKK